MNPNVKTALGIGLLVVLAAVAGAGVFVWRGSQAATWFVIIGIPATVVTAITLYVRGVVARSGTSEQQFVETRARSTGEEFQEAVRQVNDLQDSYPKWTPGIDARLQSIEGDFRGQSVTFDLETGAFDLGSGVKNAELQEFERLSNEIDDVEATIKSAFHEFAEEELTTIEDALKRLEDVGVIQIDRLYSLEEDESVPEYQDTLELARTEATETVETAIETVREMGRGDERPSSVGTVDKDLEDAAAALEDDEFGRAVESVLDARDRLRDEFSGSFEEERDAVLDLVDAVRRANIDGHVDAEYVDEVDRIESTIEGLDSALDLAELSRPRSELRRTCVDIVASMERDLERDVRTLRDAELPSGYYTEPAVVDERFVDKLDDIDDLDRFSEEWVDAATRLRDALDTASTKAAVVDAYDDVVGTIEDKLDQHGEVTGDDLPMRHADQFLGLYFRRNSDVEFDPDVPVLKRGDVETYELGVDIAYERGGETRTATIEVTGSGYNETATVETRVAGSTTFEEVPAGTHTISAEPGDGAFAVAEREVAVDRDTSIEIEFTEQSLRDQVCSDVDADMEELVPEMESRLESIFREEGYVSTEMGLPVRDSHAPCLLAVWGEHSGYDLCRDGDEIVVYDRGELERELTNVLRYNIEPGDQLRFDELEQNFLSAPVPTTVVRDVVVEIDSEYDVTTTKTAIEVN